MMEGGGVSGGGHFPVVPLGMCRVTEQLEYTYQGAAVTHVACDPRRELLWAGTGDGQIVTLHADTLQRHACWRVAQRQSDAKQRNQRYPRQQGNTPILGLAAIGPDASIASCTADSIALNDVGGFTRLMSKVSNLKGGSHLLEGNPFPTTATGIEATFPFSTAAAVGHAEGAVSLVDFARGGQVVAFCSLKPKDQSIDVKHIHAGVRCLAPYQRGVVCALNTNRGGHIAVTDFRQGNLKAAQTLSCFRGAVTCVCAQPPNQSGDLIVCAGVSRSRYGSPDLDGQGFAREALLKVFDLRYAIRAVNQYSVGFGPISVFFHARFNEHVVALSSQGVVALAECNVGNVASQAQLQRDPYMGESNAFTSGAMSTSGDVFVFGDSIGNLQVWGAHEAPDMNLGSIPMRAPTDPSLASQPTFSMGEGGHFACVPLYRPTGPLLSDVGAAAPMKVGMAPRTLPSKVEKLLTVVDTKLAVVPIHKGNEVSPYDHTRGTNANQTKRHQGNACNGRKARPGLDSRGFMALVVRGVRVGGFVEWYLTGLPPAPPSLSSIPLPLPSSRSLPAISSLDDSTAGIRNLRLRLGYFPFIFHSKLHTLLHTQHTCTHAYTQLTHTHIHTHTYACA